jgi:hypothetical protein
MFSSYEKNEDPQRAITFGDRNQCLVKGLGEIAISSEYLTILFPMFSCRFFRLQFAFSFSIMQNGLQLSF